MRSLQLKPDLVLWMLTPANVGTILSEPAGSKLGKSKFKPMHRGTGPKDPLSADKSAGDFNRGRVLGRRFTSALCLAKERYGSHRLRLRGRQKKPEHLYVLKHTFLIASESQDESTCQSYLRCGETMPGIL